MNWLDPFSRFFARFRYPVSLPEDVAKALGITVSNFLTFEQFLACLTSTDCRPVRLAKFMPREEAEELFSGSTEINRFGDRTAISYYFDHDGWLELSLIFKDGKLRRVYLNHRKITQEEGVEIPLCCSHVGSRLVMQQRSARLLRT
ncbi:MAG: hypothetical protein H7A37_00160 [Chlamydiales bacterium]|nr:hypothetical protein [Chlamydiia bacterium]MCP5506707.1 hypothetical protein [Chlamydiales bacterium]